MRYIFILFIQLLTYAAISQNYALVIHGGAGFVQSDQMSADKKQAYEMSLTQKLEAGQKMLAEGASSLDVVEAVIRMMENDSLYNSGRGSVLNSQGQVECDASIMSGIDKQAGAITGVQHIKNPISSARLVMEKSPHVMMAGSGAEEFAMQFNIDLVPNDYFITKRQYDNFKDKIKNSKHGTVGAVALDQNGNIAAGTSTGGMANKAYGRIGDSPIIGAGTYADNNTCGVSCTGHGEYFIRHAVAYDMSAMMEYGNKTVDAAAKAIIHKKLKPEAGAGGLIALDRKGNISMEFNTTAMFRGYVNQDELYIAIFKED